MIQYLENQFAPTFSQGDLQNIENRNAYINMIVKGENPTPFTLDANYKHSPKPIPEGNAGVAELVKNISRLRYGRDANLVESEIERRYTQYDSSDDGKKPPAAAPKKQGGFTPPLSSPKA